MSVTQKVLIPAKYAENAQTTQYTALNCKTRIDIFTVSNETANNVTFAANLVTSGGTAGADNRTLPTRTVAAGETYTCPELCGHVLESGGFISTLAGTASALSIRASGVEIT